MERLEGRYFFVSDVHLGQGGEKEKLREKMFLEFLEAIPEDARALFLLGDIFDFWVEYKDVVPRGYVRVLSRLAQIADSGCEVFFFKGNHDYWTTDYFEKELGVHVVQEPYMTVTLDGQRICMGHGDVLGCDSFRASLTFSLIRNRFLIGFLKALPASWVFALARKWAGKSRKAGSVFHFDIDKSYIRTFAEDLGRREKIDRFIFGHFHCESHTLLSTGARMDILGDWYEKPSYLNL